MKIVLLGPPGVGKGTGAEKLSAKYKLPHISTGDMLRDAVAKETDLGKEAKDAMDSGQLVPDELVTKMIKERLKQKDAEKGCFLDGYPRTVAQAEALQKFAPVDAVLNFTAPMKIIISRLNGRRTCRDCGAVFHLANHPPKKKGKCDKCKGELYQRSDEEPGVVTERLRVYNEQTKPLTDYYRNEGVLHDIDASYGIKEYDKILEQCDEALKN
jgi:adenylate kinase